MKGLHRREILSLLGVYHSKDIKPINKWLEKIGSKKVYADVKKRLSTAVLVDKVYQFCLFFSGRELYPYQEQFARRIIRSVIENDGEEITALFSRQSGKCLAKGTKVLMYDGSLKKVEDIKIGDKVMTPDSSYATVTNLGHGFEEMYEVQPYQGKYESTYTVNKSHILALYDTKTGQYLNMEVSKYLKLSESRKKQLCGYRARIEFKYQETDEDPYEYGYRIASTEGLYDPMDLRLDKQYLINDEIARQDLLAGILDACGHFNLNDKRRRNSVAICNVNPIIAEDYLFLLKSLGFRAFLRPIKIKNVHTKDGYKINYRIHASGDFSCIPTKTKQNPSGNCRRGDLIYHIKLKEKGLGEYFGFTIDSKDRLFVLGDFTVTHNTETVACVTCGLQVILPTLANMPMFANDPRLQPFREGIKIGIFAPALQQAQTNYMRMKGFLTSKRAVSILESEEFNLQFSTSNGQTTSLSNGSRCTCFSASERSNIEGESFNFIICEECFVKGTPVLTSTGYKPIEEIKIGEYVYSYNHGKHKIELKKVLRSFSQPLYNRKVVTITTESGKTIVCTDNHKIFNVESNTYTRADSLHLGNSVLLYNYTTQETGGYITNETESNDIRYNAWRRFYPIPRQEVFKESTIGYIPYTKTEKLCYGEVQPNQGIMFKSTERTCKSWEGFYYVPLYNKMSSITKDLPRNVLQEWSKDYNAGDFRLNDRRSTSLLVSRRWNILGNDGYPYRSLYFRRESNSKDLVRGEIQHLSNNSRRQENTQILSLLQGIREKQVPKINSSLCGRQYDVQDTHNRWGSSLHNLRENVCTLQNTEENSFMFGQMPKNSYERIESPKVFEEKIKSIKIEEHEEIEVFDLTIEDNHNFFANSILVHNCQDISNFVLTKSISPMGAAYNATKVCIGTATVFKGYFYDAIQRNKELAKNRSSHIKNHFEFDYTIASKYNPNYAKYIEKEKRNLGENSDSFRMSYKLEWIMERGMFIDIDKFEKNNLEPLMDFIDFDREATHVVGIDIGGGSGGDSTVVTVVEVDWDMPVISETRYDEDEGHEYTFDAFNTYVKYFLEIKEVPDHEEQYYIITEFLRNFKVARIVVDATREKSFADRLNANVSAEVIPYVFTVGAKSDLYKTFDKELSSGRAKLPASEKAKGTVEYEKCVQQLADLQKNWRGTNLLVSHPETRGAHDDYPDSWALAVWGCMQKGEVSEIECRDSRSLFGSPNRRNETPQMKFNRATAKRRRH